LSRQWLPAKRAFNTRGVHLWAGIFFSRVEIRFKKETIFILAPVNTNIKGFAPQRRKPRRVVVMGIFPALKRRAEPSSPYGYEACSLDKDFFRVNKPKNANGGAENRVVLLSVSICGSMGSHPEGPSRSDGISLMLSRLRRFDSRHSRF
jgi:hypothetical protein